MTRNPRYIGPTYYGHPYLDGRGVFLDDLDSPPLDAAPAAKPRREHPYPETYSTPHARK